MGVDAKKAFNHLEWHFPVNTFEAFNFPAEIINVIQIIYKYPKAKLYTNSTLSDETALERGTRQGCPLYPLLFALAIEPLAEIIRQDPNVTSISIGKHEYKQSYLYMIS